MSVLTPEYTAATKVLGKMPAHLIEIDLDFCDNEYGSAPCTASIGVTGSQECWNTRKTCQDRANYASSPRTYRFSNVLLPMSLDLEFVAINCVRSVSLTPSRITPGKGIGKRASVVVEFQDFSHSDLGLDPYLANRSYTERQSRTRGTFWTKLLARNPYYQGRRLRVRTGYVTEGEQPNADNFETRLYLIEKIEGPDTKGVVRVTAKDPLKMLDDERAKAPPASTGKLLADISDSIGTLTLTPAGIGDEEYPASGKVRVGDEIMSFTRTADLLTLTRARNFTLAAEHEADEPVQLCLSYENATITEVLYDLLVTRAGIPSSFIDLPAWELEEADWLRDYLLSPVISEPMGIAKLVAELCEQCLFFIWWDERAQLIQFKAIRPTGRDTATELNDADHVMADTQSRTERPDERITQVHVYHGQKDPTVDLDKLWNYQRLIVSFDAEAESVAEYGDSRVRVITSRWLASSNFQEATKLADRLRARFRDNPKTIKFKLEAKDCALWTGDVVAATIRTLTDFTGAPTETSLQVLEVTETKPGAEYEYVLEDTFFRGRYGFITPNTLTADYSDATEDERNRYGFIAPDTGVFADGTEAYKIV